MTLPSNIKYVTLPNGTTLKDCFIWPNFMKDLGINVNYFWNELLDLPVYSSAKSIKYGVKQNINWD